MFYVDASDIDPRVIQEPIMPDEWLGLDVFASTDETEQGIRLQLFSEWCSSKILKLLTESNPDRVSNAALSYGARGDSMRGGFTDVHTDRRAEGISTFTFVTLSVVGDGQTIGTLQPRSHALCARYQDKHVHKLETGVLERDFDAPPSLYAVVFDPDLEMHAGATDTSYPRRDFYRAKISTNYVDTGLFVPESEGVIAPIFQQLASKTHSTAPN